MENRELLEAATRGEWMLEHDKKVLEIMQNIASKIEKRAVNTKTNINTMVLSLDETRVKMSNLTRISDVKNAVYCENLITDDHTLPLTSSDAKVPQKNSVRESAEIAISNGLKLVENCFEKHKLKFDPSSSRSEETIVYRPIDQFYSPLPYLIGSDKWKEKWHLGLMESEDRQSQAGSVYADSVDSSVASKPMEKVVAQSVNLSVSQDSLAKSINSIGDQMVINSKQGGLFDEPILSSEPSNSKLQPVARNIVNFFDDEPPELSSNETSPLVKRKPTNLFDDVESVDSMPIYEPEINQEQQNVPLPPVDLFNDNDFDDFITKMEKNRNQTPNLETVNEAKPYKEEKVVESKSREVNVQRDMKSIAEEISKKVQLKKVDPEIMPVKKKIKDDQIKKTEIPPIKNSSPKVVDVPKKILPKNELKSAQEIKKEVNDETKSAQNKPKPRITNLFDDEDDSEDFFQEIMKQKASNTSKETAKVVEPVKNIHEKKISSLFDDSEEDDNFDNIFKEKTRNSTPKVTASSIQKESSISKVSTSLFEKESSAIKIAPAPLKENTEISSNPKNTKPKKLFDDDSDNDENDNLFKSNSKHANQVGQANRNDEYATLADKLDNSRAEHSKVEEIQEKPLKENNADTPSQSRVIDMEENELPNTEILKENETKVIDVSQQFEEIVPVDSALPEDDVSSPIISDDKTLSIDNNEISDEIEIESPNLEAPSLSLQIDTENEQKNSFNESVVNSSFTMPLFSDEPPDDTWDEEFNNFEEPETKPLDAHSTFSPNTSSYSVPLFDELPPEDFGDDQKNPPPIPDFDEELSDYEDKKESQLEVPQVDDIPEKFVPTQTIKEEKVIEGDNNLHIVATDKENAIAGGKPDLSNQKIENKSITLDRTEIIKEKDDNSPDVLNTSIKSKLDMFSRPPETAPVKQSEPKKLPGKLNTNLNINVGALMPGARISLKKPLVEEEPVDFSEPSVSTQPPQSTSTTSGLLNNDMTKTRAKVSVKRRPSTRVGRRSNYEKSIDSQITDSNESKRDDMSVSQNDESNIEPFPPSKNLSDSIFAEDNEEEFLPTLVTKKLDQSTTQKQPSVTTSKISVFYDDEAETKKMLEEQKEASKKQPLKLFDELSDGDNLFGKINARVSEKLSSVANQKSKQKEEKKSLFDDDNDEDDLFGSKTKIQPIKSREVQSKKDSQLKSKPLFDDDDDDFFGASSQDKKSIKKEIPSTKSLFGDESDDDDLFSVKPKSTQSKIMTAKLTATTSNKNQKTVEDDPLKDLMGN